MIKRLKNKTKTRYDLPLHRGTGGHMLVWLIGLMSYLAVISVVMVLGLNSLTQHWTGGIEDRITVEIPYDENRDNTPKTVKDITNTLNDIAGITATIIPEQDVTALVEPWFGDVAEGNADIPIPSLIDVTLDPKQPINLEEITAQIQEIEPNASLNTHQDWLQDILSFSNAIRFVVFGLAAIMLTTAVIAVGSAARTRLTLHHDEVDLLHLIGAADSYISRQFQRQTMRLAFEGAMAGLILGALTLFAAKHIGLKAQQTLMPNFHFGLESYITLLSIPVFVVLLAMVVSRITVTFALKKLP